MNSWKKVASMLLAATMLTPFAACGGGGDDSSSPEPLTNAQIAANYVDALEKAMGAKSVKLTGELNLTATEYYYTAGTTTVDPSKTVVDENQSIAFEMVISEDTEGYALKMKATMEQTAETVTNSMASEMIIKGQYMYNRNYVGDATGVLWNKQDLGMPLDVETIVETQFGVDWATVEEMLGVKEITDATNAAKEALVNGFYTQLEAGAIKDNKVSIEVNMADFVNGWIEYLNAVDESTMKFGAFVDATAAKAGIPFTYATFVDNLAAFSEKTVAEAIGILDDTLEEGYGMTLQEAKDALLATEIADMLFTQMGLDAATVAEIKAMKIEDMTAQFADVTVHQMMNQIIASSQAESAPEGGDAVVQTGDTQADPWAETLQMLVAMKDVTLADMEISIPTIPASANDLTLKGAIAFNNDGTAVTGMSFGADVAIKVEFNEETGANGTLDQPGYGLAEITANFAISEFSASTVAVAAPAENEIASDVVEGGETGDKIVQE